MRVEAFVYETHLWTLRLKDRAQGLPPGVEPDLIVGRPFTVSFIVDGGERQGLTVPAGLIFDGPSVPFYGRWFISKLGRHFEAALPHDFLYGHPGWNSRKYADRVFLAGMVAANVPKWRRRGAYAAVRLGGALRYRKGRNRYAPFNPEEI